MPTDYIRISDRVLCQSLVTNLTTRPEGRPGAAVRPPLGVGRGIHIKMYITINPNLCPCTCADPSASMVMFVSFPPIKTK